MQYIINYLLRISDQILICSTTKILFETLTLQMKHAKNCPKTPFIWPELRNWWKKTCKQKPIICRKSMIVFILWVLKTQSTRNWTVIYFTKFKLKCRFMTEPNCKIKWQEIKNDTFFPQARQWDSNTKLFNIVSLQLCERGLCFCTKLLHNTYNCQHFQEILPIYVIKKPACLINYFQDF